MPERSTALRAFSASTDVEPSRTRFFVHLRKVQGHYSQLFETAGAARPDRASRFPSDADDRETLDRLAAMGFRNPLEISAIVRGWLARHLSALAERIRARATGRARPAVCSIIWRARESRTGGAVAFDRFLPGCMPPAAGGCFRCCGRIPICWRWSRSCSAPRRGSPTSLRIIRR